MQRDFNGIFLGSRIFSSNACALPCFVPDTFPDGSSRGGIASAGWAWSPPGPKAFMACPSGNPDNLLMSTWLMLTSSSSLEVSYNTNDTPFSSFVWSWATKDLPSARLESSAWALEKNTRDVKIQQFREVKQGVDFWSSRQRWKESFQSKTDLRYYHYIS